MSEPKRAKVEIKTVELDSIVEAVYNPRIKLEPNDPDYQKILESINGFGYADPMILNGHNNVLISGHQRLNILRAMGYTQVDVSVVNITDQRKEKAMNIAMNKITGRWDEPKVREILMEFDVYDDYAKMAGYEESEFEAAKKFEETVETGELGRTAGEAKEVYDANTIKQIVLYYAGDVYEDRVTQLGAIAEEHGFESNTDVIDYLLEFYEKHRSPKAPDQP